MSRAVRPAPPAPPALPVPPAPPLTVLVWDRWVRLCHWGLVAAVAVAYFLPADIVLLHQPAGYLAMALLAFRLLWGFAGSVHARFADFVPAPRALAAHLWAMLRGKEARFLGHNPAAAAMIVVLLLLLAAATVSGWLLTLAAFRDNRLVETIHAASAHVLIGAVAVHVLGAVYTSVRHRENLILAMFTGRKRR